MSIPPTKRNTMQQPINLTGITDQVLAMLEREECGYLYRNYLPRRPDGSVDTRLNVTWREKICQWSYNVVDHFDLSREVVDVSLSLFDRYLATKGNHCNGNLALLTSLTTLHISIKLHECKKIKLSTLANLSRGQFGPKDIEQMEWKVLAAVGWKLHPPTQYSFVSLLLQYLPTDVNPAVRKGLNDLSKYLTELAVCDSYFVDVKSSTTAFASILNVMEDMHYSRLSGGLRERFLAALAYNLGLSHSDPDVVNARWRLRRTFAASAANETTSPSSVVATATATHAYSNNNNSNGDNMSIADRSVSSIGSVGTLRSRANSFDSSKGGSCCRCSPSTRRRFVTSPMARSSRSHISSSPIVAGVQ